VIVRMRTRDLGGPGQLPSMVVRMRTGAGLVFVRIRTEGLPEGLSTGDQARPYTDGGAWVGVRPHADGGRGR